MSMTANAMDAFAAIGVLFTIFLGVAITMLTVRFIMGTIEGWNDLSRLIVENDERRREALRLDTRIMSLETKNKIKEKDDSNDSD